MTNFDFLKTTPDFASFADVAISAERLIYIDPAACVFNCRRAMEFAVKWMYSVDGALSMPFDDSLHLLINSEEFTGLTVEEAKEAITKKLEGMGRAKRTVNYTSGIPRYTRAASRVS